MNLPTDFKNKISEKFFDKSFSIYTSTEEVDSEGFSRMSVEETETTFMGNVRFDSMDKIQKDYGLDDEIQMAITTHTDIEAGTIIGYNDRTYKVIRGITFDSHYLLLAQEWSVSSDLISA